MTRYQSNPRDCLVQLKMIDVFNMSPPLDKAVQGRLARTLKDVGSKGPLSVRARMITSVSNTKYKTLDGEPISLVGLHGKDEVLAVGPAWAIKRLGEGITPRFNEEVTSLQSDLELYRELAVLARDTELGHSNHRSVYKAAREINTFDAARRSEALSFIDNVIVRLETFIKECEEEKVSWWFFWTIASTKKLEEIGIPPNDVFNRNLLHHIDLSNALE